MKKLLYILLCSPIIFFTSCSSGGGGEELTPNNIDITGVWQNISLTANGEPQFYQEVLYYHWEDGTYGSEITTLDGTFDYAFGTYSISEDQSTITTIAKLASSGVTTTATSNITLLENGDLQLDAKSLAGVDISDLNIILVNTKTTLPLSNWDNPVISNIITGCMDAEATNYNPEATQETNMICLYQAELVFYHKITRSDWMIANFVNSWSYLDANNVLLGQIGSSYYYTDENTVTCDSPILNDKVVVSINWTGNLNNNTSTFTFYEQALGWPLVGPTTFTVSPNVCHRLGGNK